VVLVTVRAAPADAEAGDPAADLSVDHFLHLL
jgi:hypothetical protein